MKKPSLIAMALAVTTTACSLSANAAEPGKPVQIIVPYSAGGTTDRIARMVAAGLTQELGTSYVVVNKPGAGGTLGTLEVARARPDGQTLGVVFDAQATNHHMFKNLSYDTFKSFDYVSLIVSAPHVIVTAKPNTTLKTLMMTAKREPLSVSFGSTGVGTSNHLYPLLLARRADVKLQPIPYQGGGGSFQTDLLSSRYDFASGSLGYFLPFIKEGKLQALATGGAKRSPVLPDVPTISESYPGFEASSWVGLIAPAGLPKEISDRLRNALRKSLNVPALRNELLAEGYTIEASSSEAFEQRVKGESERLGKIIKQEKLGEQ